MQRPLAPHAAAARAVPSAAQPRRPPPPTSLTPLPTKKQTQSVATAAAAAAPQAPRTVLPRLGRSTDDDFSPLATAVEPPSREAEADANAGATPSSPERAPPLQSPTPPENDDEEEDRASAPPLPKPKGSNFYANVGTAVRTIREDLPALFQRDMDFSIYRDDVVFRDPRNAFHGIANYRTIFWSVRFHGNLFFRDLRVDILRVWQPEPREIRVRWSARGVSRLPWRPVGVFDGISTFRLDEEGMIYVHEVNNVVLRPPPGAFNALSPLFARLNLVPELEGVVQGVPSGGGGASCPGWTGQREEEAGMRRRAAPLSAASEASFASSSFEVEVEVDEEQRRWRRASLVSPSSSLSSVPLSSAEEEEDHVLVLSHEASYSYLTSLNLWRRGRAAEEEQDRKGEGASLPLAAPFFVGA